MPTIYQRILGERFDALPPGLRRFLAQSNGGRATGRLRVTRGPGPLRGLIATVLGIPPAGEYDLRLEVLVRGDSQRWERHFGPHMLPTRQCEHRGLLVESSGPASIGFELILEDEALFFRPRRAWVFGIPFPMCLAPRIEAENRPGPPDGWRVLVRFGVPWLGNVAEYEGDVASQSV